MSSSLKHPKPRIPSTVHRITSNASYNQKYAPKFINNLKILTKEKLTLRTRYMKKISSVSCFIKSDPQSQQKWKPMLQRISKRLGKVCKEINLPDSNIQSSFSSLEKCQLTGVSSLPLYLKLGRFTKINIELQAIPIDDSTPENISRIVKNITRSKNLKNLNIHCEENNLDLSSLFLVELQRYPRIISSLHIFGLHYKSSRDVDDMNRLPDSLINLKTLIQSITHLSLETYQMLNLNLQDFRKLNTLEMNFKAYPQDNFLKLTSLKTMTNLHILSLRTPLDTQDQVENLLKNFQPPKSIKKLRLARTKRLRNDFLPLVEIFKNREDLIIEPPKKSLLSNLKKFFSSKNPSEKRNTLEEFYERWRELDQLSDLTLVFQSPPAFPDIDFFFIAPILKKCRNLKNLAIWTAGLSYDNSKASEQKAHLQWAHLLKALKPSKDSLENIEIEGYKISFEESQQLSFTFKKLKSFNFRNRAMETKGLSQVSKMVPKTFQGSQLSYDITLNNEQEMQELFESIHYIPSHLKIYFKLYLSKINFLTFEKVFLNYLASAKIQGDLSINLEKLERLDPERLKRLIAKKVNLAWTGSLFIQSAFTPIFQVNKTKHH